MKNPYQAGALFILLVIPAFVFVFLHSFGTNEYTLEYFNPQAPNCPTAPEGEIHKIPPFRLVNQDSQVVTNDIYKGKIYVADFFFANCDNICIRMSSELLRVQKEFANNPMIQIISYTVDPERDTVAALKAYAEKYRVNTDSWSFLTGDKKDIYELARCGYFISAKPNEEVEDDFIHQDWFVLVDKEGHIRGKYSGTRKEDVDQLINEIYVLVNWYEQHKS